MTTQQDRDLYCLQCAGFAVIPRFLNRDRLDVIAADAAAFEEEVAEFSRAGGLVMLTHAWPLRTTRCLYAVSPAIQDLVMDETVQAFARGYLGKAVLRDCLLQTNMPDVRNAARGVGADLSYHRDTRWSDDGIRPMYLHVFLLLSDFDAHNGATVIVPGTHRLREPGYYFKDSDPRPRQSGIDYRVYERRYFPSAVQIEAPRGSLVLLDPMTIHTQGNNVGTAPRTLLNMTFRAADVKGQPPLLNARRLAERCARVPVRQDLLEILEADPSLPAHFGPLRNG